METVTHQRESANSTLRAEAAQPDHINKQGAGPAETANAPVLSTAQPQDGSGTSEKQPLELSRAELLNGLDFEIAQRETANNHYGITAWGIGGATVALLWAAMTEALQPSHIWLNVVLVLFVGKWGIGLLTTPWVKSLYSAPSGRLASSRRLPPQQFFSHIGMTLDILRYSTWDATSNLIVALYLGLNGFWLLGMAGSVTSIIVLLLLAFAWVLYHIRVPLIPQQASTTLKPPSRIVKGLVYSISGLVLLAGVGSLVSIKATLTSADIHLGLLFAGILALFGISLRFVRPAEGVDLLRSLRTRVAFGLIDVPGARKEAENLLLGTPELNFVTTKAETVLAELSAYRTSCNTTTTSLKLVKGLAEKLRGCPGEQKILCEITSAFRPEVKKQLSELHVMDRHMQMAIRLRRQLDVRVEAAKRLLSIEPAQLDAVVNGVNTGFKGAVQARQELQEVAASLRPDIEFVLDAQKDVKLPRGPTRAEIVAAIFRD